jgi:hypothetical protein
MRAGLMPIKHKHLRELGKEFGYPVLIAHGTLFPAWCMIRQTGLSRMYRTYIHFGAQESTVRGSSDVIVWVSVQKILDAGLELFRVPEGPFLCSGGPRGALGAEFFHEVTWTPPSTTNGVFFLYTEGTDCTEAAVQQHWFLTGRNPDGRPCDTAPLGPRFDTAPSQRGRGGPADRRRHREASRR